MWLECTSQTIPAGYLGSFTDNRYALLVSEDGGKLVKTKYYNIVENSMSSKAQIDIDILGNAAAKLNLIFNGRAYSSISDFSQIGLDEMEKQLAHIFRISAFTITKSHYTEKKEKLPSGIIDLNFDILNISSKANSRLIFTPGILNALDYVPNEKTNFYNKQGWQTCDTIIYSAPYGFIPEVIPIPLYLNTKFGVFDAHIEYRNEKIYYFRKMVLYSGDFVATDALITDYFNEIARYDRQRIVLYNENFNK